MRLIAALGCALLTAACTEVITEPGVPVAIEIGPLPFPALIAGDSLRDPSGTAMPIPVRVFDGRGQLIESPGVTFIALGTEPVGSVDASTGHATGVRPGTLRVVASVGGLQSTVLTIPVVPRPTALEALSELRDTLEYLAFRDHLHEIRVRLVADTGQAPLAPVASYLVDFRIVDPADLPPNDSTVVHLVNDQQRLSTRDTTAADGVATRRLRLPPWVQIPPPDSVVVEVTAHQLDGTHVAGSPMRFVVEIVPAP